MAEDRGSGPMALRRAPSGTPNSSLMRWPMAVKSSPVMKPSPSVSKTMSYTGGQLGPPLAGACRTGLDCLLKVRACSLPSPFVTAWWLPLRCRRQFDRWFEAAHPGSALKALTRPDR